MELDMINQMIYLHNNIHRHYINLMNYKSRGQGFDSYKDSKQPMSRTLTERSSKSPSSMNGKAGSHANLEDDILMNACCPNCRYIFKVVNENKLKAIKSKLKKLQTIQQQKSVNFVEKPYSFKMSADTFNNFQESQAKNRGIYKGENNFMMDENMDKKVTPNKIKTPTNKDYQKRYQQSLQNENMKKDINMMKKYLDRYKNRDSKYSPKSHNASMNGKITPFEMNNSLMNFEQPIFEGIQKLSTINMPRRQIQVSRKCQKCQSCVIELEIAKKAVKSKLIEQQLIMIAPHIEKQSPSYVKCLQLIMQTEY